MERGRQRALREVSPALREVSPVLSADSTDSFDSFVVSGEGRRYSLPLSVRVCCRLSRSLSPFMRHTHT